MNSMTEKNNKAKKKTIESLGKLATTFKIIFHCELLNLIYYLEACLSPITIGLYTVDFLFTPWLYLFLTLGFNTVLRPEEQT